MIGLGLGLGVRLGRAMGGEAVYTRSWPDNEPAGMSQLIFFDGSNKTPGSPVFVGPKWGDNNDRVEAGITDTDSRYGTVIEKRFFIGDDSDWHGVIEYNFSTVRHLYIRWIVKYSSNYQINPTNEKMFYVGGPGGDNADVYIYITPTGALALANEFPGAGFNDIALGVNMVKNQYDTYELYYVAESSASASDGEYHIWKNGVLTSASATGQNWSSGTPGWSSLLMYDFWGGSQQNKTVNDNVRISEFYVSGKN